MFPRSFTGRLSRTPVDAASFLVVDLETTGLDPRTDHIVSMAWVPVQRREVLLAEAGTALVKPPPGAQIGSSATVHGLTDDVVSAAEEVDEVMPRLLKTLGDRVLVAHHAPIELEFLREPARRSSYRHGRLTVVDTMTIQHRLELGPHGEVRPGRLRLDEARRTFGLPRYGAHRALTDAIATAELLLAQVAELEHQLGRSAVLGDLRARTRRWPGLRPGRSAYPVARAAT